MAAQGRRRVDRLQGKLHRTLDDHKEWRLNELLQCADLGPLEELALLVLLGKELRHLPMDSDLFLGAGLARAVQR